MKKNEFLSQLKYELSFFLSDDEINKNILYYEKYIDDEIKNGKSEEEVVNSLGSPILIAKTIKQVDNKNDFNTEFSTNYKQTYQDNFDNNENYKNNKETYNSPIFFKQFGTMGCFIFLILLSILSIIIRLIGSVLYFGLFGFGISGAIIFLLLIYFIYKSRN